MRGKKFKTQESWKGATMQRKVAKEDLTRIKKYFERNWRRKKVGQVMYREKQLALNAKMIYCVWRGFFIAKRGP